VPDQTVTVQYNADKTTPEKLQKGFEKFGYKARILKDGEKVEKNTEEKCDLM
jgi:periplasmic mercuric ion binding protein